jgi:hypothetical protein
VEKNDISPRAYEHWHEVNDKLRYGLHTVEMAIQEHWKRERCPAFDPIDELLDYATGLQRARATAETMTYAAQRYLAHRAKANERDRRYRERKALPAPQRAAELVNDLPAATHAEVTK